MIWYDMKMLMAFCALSKWAYPAQSARAMWSLECRSSEDAWKADEPQGRYKICSSGSGEPY